MKPRRNPNPKRKLVSEARSVETKAQLALLAGRATYGGNPEHKRNPGDFDLSPPSQPRQGKSLCDAVEIFSRTKALELIQRGLRQGLVSEQWRDGWPQNIWAVAENGMAVEAMLENPTLGTYHGYPMQDGDPLADEVVARWTVP